MARQELSASPPSIHLSFFYLHTTLSLNGKEGPSPPVVVGKQGMRLSIVWQAWPVSFPAFGREEHAQDSFIRVGRKDKAF